ncbi:MAG TPA: hypothetical protein VEY91_05960 [Candidatus Limnocylindria bacterium]|nr:hypothetical protein [Candidatus Limnocylindria bacterium]
MRAGSWVRVGAALAWLLPGCTTLREVPRAEYAVRPERSHVEVETREGQRFGFDFARFTADSLTGFQRGDDVGSLQMVDAHTLALERVSRLSARGIDWYRTGLIGGVVVAAAVAAVLSQTGGGGNGGGGDDGGMCGPRGCP